MTVAKSVVIVQVESTVTFVVTVDELMAVKQIPITDTSARLFDRDMIL